MQPVKPRFCRSFRVGKGVEWTSGVYWGNHGLFQRRIGWQGRYSLHFELKTCCHASPLLALPPAMA